MAKKKIKLNDIQSKPISQEKKEIKLFLATPAFGNQVTTTYMNSVLKMINHPFPDIKLSTMFHLQSGMALVTQARNNCVDGFLKSDCDKMLFVDADIGFEPEAVGRLVRKCKDNVVLTPYPVKGYNDKGGLQFIVHFKNNKTIEVDDDGFVEITGGPTGFMMIDRSVFTKMIKAYPEKKTVNSQLIHQKVEKMDKDWYTFFETDIHPEHGYLGEDIAFCNLWTKIGGKIYADSKTALTHYGGHGYKGSLDMMFQPLDVDETAENK